MAYNMPLFFCGGFVMTAQTKINDMQLLYKEWQIAKTNAEAALIELKKSNQMIRQLENFYFDGEWSDIYERIEQGEPLDLTTTGDYSVMAEDTLWNAFHEQQTMLWEFLRTATKALDKDRPDFYSDNE